VGDSAASVCKLWSSDSDIPHSPECRTSAKKVGFANNGGRIPFFFKAGGRKRIDHVRATWYQRMRSNSFRSRDSSVIDSNDWLWRSIAAAERGSRPADDHVGSWVWLRGRQSPSRPGTGHQCSCPDLGRSLSISCEPSDNTRRESTASGGIEDFRHKPPESELCRDILRIRYDRHAKSLIVSMQAWTPRQANT